MKNVPSKIRLIAALALCGAAMAAPPALAFEPSDYDAMSRPIGFDDDRRDPLRPIGFTRGDADGNRVRHNGVSSLAAGNIIAVTIQGHGNTVQIEANQKNSGDINASTVLNGHVFLNR